MFQNTPSEDRIISEIYKMQQRGGRMLSIVDLIKAQTVSIKLAAHLLTLIVKGISISSGSMIGGTGKTTLLASLLSFLPEDRALITVTSSNLKNLITQRNNKKNAVYLCHEISPANYFSYLWGKDISYYFNLKRNNNNLAFTIHADDLDEVYSQIVNENTGLSDNDFLKIDALIFIKSINNGYHGRRVVTYLYEKDVKSAKHILTYTFRANNFTKINDSPLIDDNFKLIETKMENFLTQCINKNIYKIEEIRKIFLPLLPEILQ